MNNLAGQIDGLKTKTLAQLQGQFEALFGKKADSTNDTFLRRKIAYRLQEYELGGLSKNAKARLSELIEKYDPVNNKALRPRVTAGGRESKTLPSMRDKRLPIPGTIIRRKYKDQNIEVRVLEKGFEYKGKYFRSLTGIVLELTGCQHWNGFKFFGM